jgi:hypothetical protein
MLGLRLIRKHLFWAMKKQVLFEKHRDGVDNSVLYPFSSKKEGGKKSRE